MVQGTPALAHKANTKVNLRGGIAGLLVVVRQRGLRTTAT